MKLRQKSYFLTVLLIGAVLFLSTLFLLLPNVRSAVSSIEARALGEEKALALAVEGLSENIPKEDRRKYVRGFAVYDSGGSTFAVGLDEETWIATEPLPPETEPGRVRWLSLYKFFS